MKKNHRRPLTPYWNSPKGECRWCGNATGRNLRWHKECVSMYLLATSSYEQRKLCRERDNGVCKKCGIDTLRERRIASESIRMWQWFLNRELPNSSNKQTFISQIISTEMRCKGWPASLEEGRWWQADHITALCISDRDPVAFGPSNLQTLCWSCHKAKTKQDIQKKKSSK